ncbi:MAG TPA: response regulator [Flavisolibacter sp.]|jgi:CheY-like chemotaxis protein
MKSIYLVDDDRDDAGLFCEAVAEINAAFDVKHFESVPDAIKALQSEKSPDILFLDINLPVTSGWELLKQVKQDKELAGIPVIIYSTSSQAREKQMAKELGAAGFITKPNGYDEMIEELGMVLK